MAIFGGDRSERRNLSCSKAGGGGEGEYLVPLMPSFTDSCLAYLFLTAAAGFALETASYVNDAASLPIGARTAGVAGISLGMPGDPSHLAMSPAGLADVSHPEVVFHHARLYEDLSLSQDELYLAAPLSYGTIGLGISHIGADGILRAERGQSPDFSDPSTFAATDWIVSLAFARTWLDRRLRAGAALRMLGRDIDSYYGGGAQLDASVVWLQSGFRAGMKLDRGIGGLATWESGRTEYSPPDLVAGLGYEHRVPYFYGQGSLAWETPGLVQKQASSTFSSGDARLWVDPWLFLRSSRIGGEFRFDMGLVLRAGCEIQSLTRALDFLQGEDQQGQFGDSRGSVSVGAGYLWANKVRVDYALVSHPDLGNTQRFSLGLVFGGSAPKPVAVEREVPSRTARPAVSDTTAPRGTSIDSLRPVAPIDSIAPDSGASASPVSAVDSSAKPRLSADSAAIAAPVADSSAVVPSSSDSVSGASPVPDSAAPVDKASSPSDSSLAPVPVLPSAPDTSGTASVPQEPVRSTPVSEPVSTGNSASEAAPAATSTPDTPALAPVPKPRPSGPADEWDAPEQLAP